MTAFGLRALCRLLFPGRIPYNVSSAMNIHFRAPGALSMDIIDGPAGGEFWTVPA
jgi:hypothetical protein